MIVIKVGGGVGNVLDPTLDDLAERWHRSERWILVHGGSARTDEVSTALDHPPSFVVSPKGFQSRRTDRKTAEIFAMVYSGDVNTRIVEGLQARGVNAVGLNGLDGRLLEGPRKKALRVVENGRQRILRDDFTGKVERVNAPLLRLLLEGGYAPVVCPPAISTEHEIINVDGDRAAARIAAAMRASHLILLTGAPGLLRDASDPQTVIGRLESAQLEDHIEHSAKGRMKLKLVAAGEALESGVREVVLSASDQINPISFALSGGGTHIITPRSQDSVTSPTEASS